LSESKLRVSDEQRAEIQKQEALRLAEQTAREAKTIQFVSTLIVTGVSLVATMYFFSSFHTLGDVGLGITVAMAGTFLSIAINRTRPTSVSIKQAFGKSQAVLFAVALLFAAIGPNLNLLFPYRDTGAECNDLVFCSTGQIAYGIFMVIAGVISIMASLVLTAVAGGRLIAKLNSAIIAARLKNDTGRSNQPKEFQEPK
jgi:hypothetical protein